MEWIYELEGKRLSRAAAAPLCDLGWQDRWDAANAKQSASLLPVISSSIGRLSIMHSPADLCSSRKEPGLHNNHLESWVRGENMGKCGHVLGCVVPRPFSEVAVDGKEANINMKKALLLITNTSGCSYAVAHIQALCAPCNSWVSQPWWMWWSRSCCSSGVGPKRWVCPVHDDLLTSNKHQWEPVEPDK